MSDPLVRVSEAARRLDISTKQLLVLIHEREIGYVMLNGIAHVPVDAINEYRSKVS